MLTLQFIQNVNSDDPFLLSSHYTGRQTFSVNIKKMKQNKKHYISKQSDLQLDFNKWKNY